MFGRIRVIGGVEKRKEERVGREVILVGERKKRFVGIRRIVNIYM